MGWLSFTAKYAYGFQTDNRVAINIPALGKNAGTGNFTNNINTEDKRVPDAIEKVIPQIEQNSSMRWSIKC